MVQRIPTTDDVISTVYRWVRVTNPLTGPVHFEIHLSDGRKISLPLFDVQCVMSAEEKAEYAAEYGAENAEFSPSELQAAILDALDGQAMKVEKLLAVLGCSRATLYAKKGGILELKMLNKVQNHRQYGYYRPDAPPPEIQ